jgi:hypothetical protein
MIAAVRIATRNQMFSVSESCLLADKIRLRCRLFSTGLLKSLWKTRAGLMLTVRL